MAPAPRFEHGPFDRLIGALRLSQPAMMILRGLLRWPLRAAMTTLGLAFGVAILVASTFLTDSLDEVIDTAFFRANRQHATLILANEAPIGVALAARDLPGVLAVEPQFDLSVTLRHGPRSKRLAITARPPGGDLARALDAQGRVVEIPRTGLLLSRHLADQLGVERGDSLRVEVEQDRGHGFDEIVTAVTTQYLGLGAYMDLDALAARLDEAPRATALHLALDPAELPGFHAAIKTLPEIASSVLLTEIRDSFRGTISENIRRNTILFLTISVLITSGVAYNGARIQLSERARELASLRILGFMRIEASSILLGETAVLALLAQPVGWAIGAWISSAMVAGFDSDLYRIPLVLKAANFATASLVTLAVTLASALLVRRRFDRADIVAVLKTRE
ncbi:ABC transporter permease [Limimaricola litoreus]